MTEKSRRKQKQAEEIQSLETVTSEEKPEQIRDVARCIAWFVSNRNIQATSAQVAAGKKDHGGQCAPSDPAAVRVRGQAY